MVTKENNTGFEQLGRLVAGIEIPPFVAGLKWRGGDLQTMRNTVLGPALPLFSSDCRRVSFDLGEGRGLSAALHASSQANSLPLMVIIHGLTGSEESPNVVSATAYFTTLGYPVLRLNLRGAGPSAATSYGPYHGGLTEDLEKVIEQLLPRRYGLGIVLYGISLGGNMMLKYLGEKGGAAKIRAAIGVSAPLSLKAVQARLRERRNRMYHNYLLLGLKKAARNVAEYYEKELIDRAQAARSIYEYDDGFVAPAHGMSGAEEYYARHSAGKFLSGIRAPTLLIHARNDPWIPVDGYTQQSWPDQGAISLLVAEDGGHAGFHGADHNIPWHDRVAALYLKTVLTEDGEA